MKTLSILILSLTLTTFVISSANSQVMVGNKNVNDDKEIQYIQLLYYIEKSSLRPVYMIDYGIIDNTGNKAQSRRQAITINEEEVRDLHSPVLVLNRLDKAGWEYLGDGMYVQAPLLENWYSMTLRRKK